MVAKSPERENAIRDGLTHYFTGTPCKRGHIAKRLVSNKSCVVCAEEARKKNQSKYRNTRAEYREKNKENLKQKADLWARNNKENQSKRTRRWAQANKGLVNARNAKYRASKLNATPPWLTTSQKNEIKRIYKEATEKGKTVDHVVPLQNDFVCGLHVPWNLAVITMEENSKKGNSL